jgi:hypothetical protein
VLEPVIARYRERGLPPWLRGDAAFAKLDLHELLEAERIGHLLTRPVCRPASKPQVFFANFLCSLALPRGVEQWWLTTLREKLVKIGARIVRHGRSWSSSSLSLPCRGRSSPRSCG